MEEKKAAIEAIEDAIARLSVDFVELEQQVENKATKYLGRDLPEITIEEKGPGTIEEILFAINQMRARVKNIGSFIENI